MKNKIIIAIRLVIILVCICGVSLAVITDEDIEKIDRIKDPEMKEDVVNWVNSGGDITLNWNYIPLHDDNTNVVNSSDIVEENTNIVDNEEYLNVITTEKDFENVSEFNYYDAPIEKKVGCSEHTYSGTSLIINVIFSIVQLLGTPISIILIAIGVCYNLSVKRKVKLSEKNIEDKNINQLNELKEKKDKAQNFLMFCIIMGITIFAFSSIVGIVRNFAAKPIIYIYPTEETEVSVKFDYPEKITCSYPKYEGEWKVNANPNGDLVDLKTGRKLYALYWEGINDNKSKMKEGFIVKGEESAKFLEEKLEILGLNEREAEEFIVYWLPKMEKNKYNYIRFETMEEINAKMPLEITPNPDTLIRVMMEVKGLKKPIDIEIQELEKVERNGYTVVEWGGTEL